MCMSISIAPAEYFASIYVEKSHFISAKSSVMKRNTL